MKLWHADTKMTYNTVSAIYGCVTNMALCVTNTQWLRTKQPPLSCSKVYSLHKAQAVCISPLRSSPGSTKTGKSRMASDKSGISTKMTATGQHPRWPSPSPHGLPTPGLPSYQELASRRSNSGFLTQHSRQQASKNCKASCSLDQNFHSIPSTRFYLYKQVMRSALTQ